MTPVSADKLRSLISGYSKVAILTDSTVGQIHSADLLCSVPELSSASMLITPSGRKDVETAVNAWKWLSDSGMTRDGVLINFGGGSVTDLGGFIASTFKRGIDYINIPTTLLAMVDASVGGKTGIDFNGLKNEVGTFSLPKGIIADASFLKSLPEPELLSGFGEMLKTGLIADANLYGELISLESPIGIDPQEFNPLIDKTIRIKEAIVSKDPAEKGLRKILNFGHTVGHAYESRLRELKRPVPHGIAIAWGLLTELILSHMYQGLDSITLYPLARLLRENYPTYPFDCGVYGPLLELMSHDKKNRGDGRFNFTLVPRPGEAVYDCLLTPEEVLPAIDATFELMGK